MNKKSVITAVQVVRIIWELDHQKWISPDVVMFIESYFEQNPQVKRTRHLERKLEREFYRSLRKKNKERNS